MSGVHITSDDHKDGSNLIESRVGQKLAPFNPTSDEVIDIALRLLNIEGCDVLYDLGCGDARLLVRACELCPTISAVGVEYDLDLVGRANRLICSKQLSSRITLVHGNVLDVEFSNASAVFIYLVPEGMKMLRDRLITLLANNVRIVTYVFKIPGVEPKQIEIYKSSTKIYLYG